MFYDHQSQKYIVSSSFFRLINIAQKRKLEYITFTESNNHNNQKVNDVLLEIKLYLLLQQGIVKSEFNSTVCKNDQFINIGSCKLSNWYYQTTKNDALKSL